MHNVSVPRLIVATGAETERRYLAFFESVISNQNSRRSYLRAVTDFLAYCETEGVRSISDVQASHVGAYVEHISLSLAIPTVKGHLSAIRRLFDWLLEGGVLDKNPAAEVPGPKLKDEDRKTAILELGDVGELIDGIDDSTIIGLRDRALIAVMVYAFARIGTVLAMKVEDVFMREGELWLRFHDDDAGDHEVNCDLQLAGYLQAYIIGCQIAENPSAPFFQTIRRGTDRLSGQPLVPSNVYQRIRLYASMAGVTTKISSHTFRATGLVAYLRNGGTLEDAAAKANHRSIRTTRAYHRPVSKKSG